MVVRRLGAARSLDVRRGQGASSASCCSGMGVLPARRVGLARRAAGSCWSRAARHDRVDARAVRHRPRRRPAIDRLDRARRHRHVLGIGLSWARMRQRVTGEVEIERRTLTRRRRDRPMTPSAAEPLQRCFVVSIQRLAQTSPPCARRAAAAAGRSAPASPSSGTAKRPAERFRRADAAGRAACRGRDTCGSANTWSIVLIGPQGTPRGSSASSQSRCVRVRSPRRSSAPASRGARTRSALFAKRGSRAHSGFPAASQNFANCESLPTARIMCPSAHANAW